MRSTLVALLLFSGIGSFMTHVIPPTPCPLVFNYFTDGDSRVYGEIVLPNDGSQSFKIEVNASYTGVFEEGQKPKLRMDLTTPIQFIRQARQLTFKFSFTRQDRVPRITQIKFNGRIYCSGPDEPSSTLGSTSLWAGKEISFRTSEPNQPRPGGHRPSSPPRLTDARIDSDSDPECGISGNGEDNEFPWLVALFESPGLNYEFKCTGTLIDKYHVLTVGNCLRFHNSKLIKEDDILLVIGKSNLHWWAESKHTLLRRVSKINVHPDYEQYTGHGDIAILTMDKPVRYSETIKPVCLWSESDNDLSNIIGQYGTVAGWGKDHLQQEFMMTAKKVETPIVSPETCKQSNEEFRKLTSRRTFCAGAGNDEGACAGDRGSSLMMKNNGKWIIRGLVSQGIVDKRSSQCNSREYLVFTDISKYSRWIKSKLD